MIGTALGPYRLTAELGSGGMGRVYRATVEGRVPGLEVGAAVAVKLVYPHLLEHEGFFKRFLREAAIGRQVVHENVVRTLDVDVLVVDGRQQHFLVMELVEGQTLRGLLQELGRVPEDRLDAVADACAEALQAGIANGDVVVAILARKKQPPAPPSITTPEALKLRTEPIADCARYDNLRKGREDAEWNATRSSTP